MVNHKHVYLTILSVCLSVSGAQSDDKDGLTDTLESLFQEYFEWKLKTYPEWATIQGLEGFNHLVENFTMKAIQKKGEMCQQFLDRSVKLTPINPDYKIYKQVFQAELETCVKGMKHKGFLLPPINFIEGIQVTYPRMIREKGKTPLRSLSDYEDLLKRLKSIPAMIDQIIDLLKEGMKDGITYSRHSLRGVDEQFQKLHVKVNSSDFYIRFRDMPGSLGRHVVNRLRTSAYEEVEENVLPAFKRLEEFIKFEYSTKLRSTPGISSIPKGQEFYSSVLKWHISTDQTPEEVHKIGLEEVKNLQSGVSEVITQLGKNLTNQEFSNLMREDKSQRFDSKTEATSYYKDILTEKINPLLPKLFPEDMLTEEVYSMKVAESPSGGVIAYYEEPSRDGTRPGIFYISLDPLDAQTKYEAVTLTLHEGNPGHNLQFVFNKNQKSLPRFMASPMFERYSEAPSRFPMHTSHVEGWGLYSEFLGFEMGLYEKDLYARYGHYSLNLLRSCRLVVDTGIHYLGWSREKAVQYMMDNTAMSRDNVESEVDRYITWPGQACAYKIGERKIKELRNIATTKLGDKFQIQEFHKTILKCPGLMITLESCINNMITQSSAASTDYLDDSEEATENKKNEAPEIRKINTMTFIIGFGSFVRYLY